MYCVYILFSEKLNKYYIGTTDNFKERLSKHNSGAFEYAYTKKGIPWGETLVIKNLDSKQAYAIEHHIKRMKSAVYIENLIKYESMQLKLVERYH